MSTSISLADSVKITRDLEQRLVGLELPNMPRQRVAYACYSIASQPRTRGRRSQRNKGLYQRRWHISMRSAQICAKRANGSADMTDTALV